MDARFTVCREKGKVKLEVPYRLAPSSSSHDQPTWERNSSGSLPRANIWTDAVVEAEARAARNTHTAQVDAERRRRTAPSQSRAVSSALGAAGRGRGEGAVR